MTKRVSMVRVEEWHYAKLVPGPQHDGEKVGRTKNAFTFLLEGEPIAIVGVFKVTEGVIHGWAYFSDLIKKCALGFTRSLKELCDIYLSESDIFRIQFTVKSGFSTGIRFAETLGFTQEGVLRSYGGIGKDYLLFARVKNDRT